MTNDHSQEGIVNNEDRDGRKRQVSYIVYLFTTHEYHKLIQQSCTTISEDITLSDLVRCTIFLEIRIKVWLKILRNELFQKSKHLSNCGSIFNISGMAQNWVQIHKIWWYLLKFQNWSDSR